MTEEQLNKQTKQRELKASANKLSENKRRRLIKGAVAIPVIMTLHSGAALARSSNLVTRVSFDAFDDAAQDNDGLICLVPSGDMADPNSDPVDLGTNPGRIYFNKPEIGEDINLAEQATTCETGQGVLIHNSAWTSIMSDPNITL